MDWNKINTLLSVIHQAASAGPKYAYIAQLADAELHPLFNQSPNVPAADEVEVEDEDETPEEDEDDGDDA